MTFQTAFWKKVRKTTSGCWGWVGASSGAGYGHTRIGGRNISAHRTSWELHFGAVPDGMCVLHRCDNRRCVRPDHLFLGTLSDNSRDCVEKGRHGQARKTHCKRGHEFNEANTYTRHDGRGGRACRACNRIAVDAYSERCRVKP